MYRVRIDHMNLHQIAGSGQCFRWRMLGESAYGIHAFGRYLEIAQEGDDFLLSCGEGEWNEIWKTYFDMDTDYREAERIVALSEDKFLKAAYRFGSGIRILRQDLWEVLVSFIISQNNNIPRIRKSIERICDGFGGRFPDCHELWEMDLSDKGLGYRDKYLKEAAVWWMGQEGAAGSELWDMEVPKERLLEIKGVGNKVADCICLFGLHRLEVFPVDTHISKILDREYGGRLPDWSGVKFAGLFQQYIFYHDLMNKGQERPKAAKEVKDEVSV
ncbi:8-oxoguanine DNA glycosylase [bacterium D16-50]|nr:8-oxoguanine DNA glycosylase [bacterium D16-50]